MIKLEYNLDMQTIAQQLNIKDFPFEIKDKNGRQIYWEDHTGDWYRCEYDPNGYQTYYESSGGFCSETEYAPNGDLIYYKNSDGLIIDNRPKSEVQKAIEILTKEGMLVDGKIIKN